MHIRQNIRPKSTQSVNCALINARSIRNKLNQLETFVITKKLSLLCITETWLSDVDPENILLALGKFDVYVCNRSTRGGGCAILCDPDKISSKLIANINGTGYELLVIDLYFPVNLRVFCAYRAP